MADKTRKNIFDDGYTTYHEDGTKSVSYKNFLDDGVTTYHEDGSKTVTYKNVLDDGYTSYHTPAPRATKPVIPQEPVSPPAPKVNEAWKSAGQYDSVKPAELENLGSVSLDKTRARQFAWYAAEQLKKSKVPFSDKAQGEQYWTLKYNVENDTKTDADRENYTYDVLTENGFYRKGDVRLYYNYKSTTHTVDKYRDDWQDAEPYIPYIDLFLKKNNIGLSSAGFSQMPQSEIDALANWDKVYAAQDKAAKRRQTKVKNDSIESSMRWYAPNFSYMPNWVFIVIWLVLGALCTKWGDVDAHGHLILTLAVIGAYFMTRQHEAMALKTCAGAFCFSWAFLWYQMHSAGTPILVLTCVAMVAAAGYVTQFELNDHARKTLNDYVSVLAIAFLGLGLAGCIIKLETVGLWMTIALALLVFVGAILSIVQIIKSLSSGRTRSAGEAYWSSKRLIVLGVSLGLVVVLLLLAKVLSPVMAGGLFLALCIVAGAFLTKRTDSRALMSYTLMTFPTIAMLCVMALRTHKSFDKMLPLAGDMDGMIHVSIIQPAMNLVLSFIEWAGGLMETAAGCVAEVFSTVAVYASFMPDWLMSPETILWCGISWLLAFICTTVGVCAGYSVSKWRK